MLETGNWCISDLVGYLVQVQNTLTPDELSRLKSFEAFTNEGAQGDVGKRPRYRAVDLYPPLDIFRQLQLPLIDWGGKARWQNESDQGKQLALLQLNTVQLNRVLSSRISVSSWLMSFPASEEDCDALQ